MANLVLQDSGYIRSTNAGTQLTSDKRVNSGNAISLKGITVTLSSNSNMDSTPKLSNTSDSQTNITSIENMQISITGVFNMKESADQALVYPLSQLPRTLGYKYLFYNSVAATDYPERQVVYQMANGHLPTAGEKTAMSIGGNYPHLHVLFNSFSCPQQAGNPIVNWELKGIVLLTETSTI